MPLNASLGEMIANQQAKNKRPKSGVHPKTEFGDRPPESGVERAEGAGVEAQAEGPQNVAQLSGDVVELTAVKRAELEAAAEQGIALAGLDVQAVLEPLKQEEIAAEGKLDAAEKKAETLIGRELTSGQRAEQLQKEIDRLRTKQKNLNPDQKQYIKAQGKIDEKLAEMQKLESGDTAEEAAEPQEVEAVTEAEPKAEEALIAESKSAEMVEEAPDSGVRETVRPATEGLLPVKRIDRATGVTFAPAEGFERTKTGGIRVSPTRDIRPPSVAAAKRIQTILGMPKPPEVVPSAVEAVQTKEAASGDFLESEEFAKASESGYEKIPDYVDFVQSQSSKVAEKNPGLALSQEVIGVLKAHRQDKNQAVKSEIQSAISQYDDAARLYLRMTRRKSQSEGLKQAEESLKSAFEHIGKVASDIQAVGEMRSDRESKQQIDALSEQIDKLKKEQATMQAGSPEYVKNQESIANLTKKLNELAYGGLELMTDETEKDPSTELGAQASNTLLDRLAASKTNAPGSVAQMSAAIEAEQTGSGAAESGEMTKDKMDEEERFVLDNPELADKLESYNDRIYRIDAKLAKYAEKYKGSEQNPLYVDLQASLNAERMGLMESKMQLMGKESNIGPEIEIGSAEEIAEPEAEKTKPVAEQDLAAKAAKHDRRIVNRYKSDDIFGAEATALLEELENAEGELLKVQEDMTKIKSGLEGFAALGTKTNTDFYEQRVPDQQKKIDQALSRLKELQPKLAQLAEKCRAEEQKAQAEFEVLDKAFDFHLTGYSPGDKSEVMAQRVSKLNEWLQKAYDLASDHPSLNGDRRFNSLVDTAMAGIASNRGKIEAKPKTKEIAPTAPEIDFETLMVEAKDAYADQPVIELHAEQAQRLPTSQEVMEGFNLIKAHLSDPSIGQEGRAVLTSMRHTLDQIQEAHKAGDRKKADGLGVGLADIQPRFEALVAKCRALEEAKAEPPTGQEIPDLFGPAQTKATEQSSAAPAEQAATLPGIHEDLTFKGETADLLYDAAQAEFGEQKRKLEGRLSEIKNSLTDEWSDAYSDLGGFDQKLWSQLSSDRQGTGKSEKEILKELRYNSVDYALKSLEANTELKRKGRLMTSYEAQLKDRKLDNLKRDDLQDRLADLKRGERSLLQELKSIEDLRKRDEAEEAKLLAEAQKRMTAKKGPETALATAAANPAASTVEAGTTNPIAARIEVSAATAAAVTADAVAQDGGAENADAIIGQFLKDEDHEALDPGNEGPLKHERTEQLDRLAAAAAAYEAATGEEGKKQAKEDLVKVLEEGKQLADRLKEMEPTAQETDTDAGPGRLSRAAKWTGGKMLGAGKWGGKQTGNLLLGGLFSATVNAPRIAKFLFWDSAINLLEGMMKWSDPGGAWTQTFNSIKKWGAENKKATKSE